MTPRKLQDPRCRPGAYIREGNDLYEVMNTSVSGTHWLGRHCWVVLENTVTGERFEIDADKIRARYKLVRAAQPVPDFAPAL